MSFESGLVLGLLALPLMVAVGFTVETLFKKGR